MNELNDYENEEDFFAKQMDNKEMYYGKFKNGLQHKNINNDYLNEFFQQQENFRSNEIDNLSNSEHHYETKSENKPYYGQI